MTEGINRLRNLLNDGYKFNSEVQEYMGSSKIFTLEFANIDSTTLVVKKNGTIWVSANYTYSALTSQITVTGTLISGDNLTFSYNAYERYSDNELKAYLRNAIYYIAIEKYRVFTAKSDDIFFPTPTDSEYSLIAIVAAILIKGNIKQYKTPEFSITFNENISVEDKIKKTLRQYKKAFGYITYVDLTKEMAETEDN